jgi:hypothetical protein
MEKFEKREDYKINLIPQLKEMGVDDYILEKYKKLIENIDFINIKIDKKINHIHLLMLGALFSRQDNNKSFLKNILKNIDLDKIEKIEVKDEMSEAEAKDMDIENIDLNMGANRRVNRIDCFLSDNKVYSFTLSADFSSGQKEESNSWQEKEVLTSSFSEDNPIMQNFYGYFSKNFDSKKRYFIAKEFLPGLNIAYFLNIHTKTAEDLFNFLDISSDLAYSMAYLYNKGKGQIPADLKLENIIYNYENSDESEYSCRVCDQAGFYKEEEFKKSAYQILAHLQSLLTLFQVKKNLLETKNDDTIEYEELLDSYLETFLRNLEPVNLSIFKENIKDILDKHSDQDIFEVEKDIIEYVESYLN